jgi:hypothetical protein
VSRVNADGGLGAVVHLGDGAMEVDILDIQLVHELALGDDQSQHNADYGRLHEGVESLIIVHTEALGEPPEDPMSLVPI